MALLPKRARLSRKLNIVLVVTVFCVTALAWVQPEPLFAQLPIGGADRSSMAPTIQTVASNTFSKADLMIIIDYKDSPAVAAERLRVTPDSQVVGSSILQAVAHSL